MQVALLSSPIQFSASTPNPAPASIGPKQPVLFFTDGPDRPPRSVLA